jgi:peptide/nickel transport system substrate-binding protein
MVRTRSWLARALALGLTAALVLAACGGPGPTGVTGSAPVSSGPVGESQPPTGPQKGGTIYLLTRNENFTDIDPQRIYTGEDLAFFGATIMRSLVSYIYSEDDVEGNTLTPDLATDTGQVSEDGLTWTFTLRDGLMWEDGTELKCEDVAYGVSRAYDTEIMGGGPTYQIQYLDIPFNEDDSSQYPGPYKATEAEQALFDEAVSCDGKTITFKMNKPNGTFNYATTLGMSPVPNPVDHPDVDIGEGYGISNESKPLSNGPYRVEDYSPGVGGTMTLVRNDNWSEEQDPIRKAYPDEWVVQLGLNPKLVDTRLLDPSGEDVFALSREDVQPENLTQVFSDPLTVASEFEGRAAAQFDPYTSYYWIDVNKVTNVKHRQAISVAMDREAIRTAVGGDFAGDFATGAIKPNLGADYADTGLFTGLYGQEFTTAGDPDFAKQLIEESGEPMPELTWNFAESEVSQLHFAALQSSLAEAGITVNPGSLPPGDYYNIVFDPDNEQTGEFGNTGWGPDFPNAATVIAPLYTQLGGWDLSQVEDEAYEDKIQDALATLDRQEQALKWQALDKEAVEKAWIIPTFFTYSQNLAGGSVGPIYRWPAYGSWPYAIMYVTP